MWISGVKLFLVAHRNGIGEMHDAKYYHDISNPL